MKSEVIKSFNERRISVHKGVDKVLMGEVWELWGDRVMVKNHNVQ